MRRVKFRATTWPAIGFPNFFHAGGHFKDILNCRKAARAALVVTQFEATARAVRRAAFPNRWYSLWPDRGPRCVELFAVPALLPASYRTGGGLQRPSDFCTAASQSAANDVLSRGANSPRTVHCLDRPKPPVKFVGLQRSHISVHEFRKLASFTRSEVAIRHCSGNYRHRRGRIGG